MRTPKTLAHVTCSIAGSGGAAIRRDKRGRWKTISLVFMMLKVRLFSCGQSKARVNSRQN